MIGGRSGSPARFVVVGCGTVVPEADRACSCYYVEAGPVRALLDCGSGALQALARLSLPWPRLTHVVLTHFHVDHVGALPGLLFALKYGLESPRKDEPLEVWGPPGTAELFQRLAGALGDFLLDPGFPLSVREISPGSTDRLGDLRVRTHKTPHTAESMAVRVEHDGVAITYTGDTGPDEALGEFASGSDILVCECSLPDEAATDNHLSPSRVARLARIARPGELLLTHVYPQLRRKDVLAQVVAAGYSGAASLAREGWSVDLGA